MTIKVNGLYCFHIHGDFTPVCTTEIIAFAKANTYFENLSTSLIGLSVDSNSSHLAWLYDIYLKTGIKVQFPIISDLGGCIARKYGMISNDINSNKTIRNVFIIDDKGIIRLILVYPMEVGRCIPEIIRTVNALQIADKYEVSIPANWIYGEPVIQKNPNTFGELINRVKEIDENKNGISWYLSFQQIDEKNNNENIQER